MTDTAITIPDVQPLRQESTAIDVRAKALVITRPEDFQLGASLKVESKTIQKRIREVFDPLAQQADRLHKSITKQRGDLLAPLMAVDEAVDAKMRTYSINEERKRVEEENRLREIARREQAEREAAERKRIGAELAKARAEREAAEAAALEQAAALEADGHADIAAEVLAQAQADTEATIQDVAQQAIDIPPPAPLPVVATVVPKVAGVSQRKVIDFEITDPSILPRSFVVPNETAIRAQVRATGLSTRIPGVRVFESIGFSTRTR